MDIKKEFLHRNIKQEAEVESYLNNECAPFDSTTFLDVKFEDSSEIRQHDCKEIESVQTDDVEIVSETLHCNRICRLCAKCIASEVFLYGDIDYEERINFTFPIRVAEEDGLPEYICSECEVNLNSFYNFALKVVEADKKIKSKFSSDIKILQPHSPFYSEKVQIEEVTTQDKVEVCKKIVPFACDKCEKLFLTYKSLQNHRQNKHFALVCEICGMQFMSDTCLGLHRSQHTEVERFQCVVCLKKFTIRHKLQRHTRQCHSGSFSLLLQ